MGLDNGVRLTWFGHATWILRDARRQAGADRPLGDRQPGRAGAPEGPGAVDVILLTHGHSDHIGDVAELAARALAGGGDLHRRAGRLPRGQGRPERRRHEQGRHGRGRRHPGDAWCTASHSSSFERGRRQHHLPGRAGGYIVTLENGFTDLRRRRHLRVRRHGADRPAVRARRRRSCRSATTSRWARSRPPRRSGCWASSRSCRPTTARSRPADRNARRSCARAPRTSAASRCWTSSPAARSNDLLAGRVRPRGAASGASSVASKFPAVGAVVPWARGDVGAIATQSYANVAYGPDGLELLGRRLPCRADGRPA